MAATADWCFGGKAGSVSLVATDEVEQTPFLLLRIKYPVILCRPVFVVRGCGVVRLSRAGRFADLPGWSGSGKFEKLLRCGAVDVSWLAGPGASVV